MSKVWLVTGSSRGLGRQVVKAALERGDRVLATARRPEALADLVRNTSDRLRTIAHDVTVPSQATVAVHAALDAFGRLDVVVNNAGYAELASVEDITDEGVPRSDRGSLLRHRVHHEGGAAGPPRAGQRAHHQRHLGGQPDGDPWPVGLSKRQVGHGRFLRGARRRGRATRNPGDLARTGRHGDRLGRLVDDRARDRGPTSRPSAPPPRCTTLHGARSATPPR